MSNNFFARAPPPMRESSLEDVQLPLAEFANARIANEIAVFTHRRCCFGGRFSQHSITFSASPAWLVSL